MDAGYGDGVTGTFSIDVDFDLNMKLAVPHWCHPGDNPFCDE